jgi:hypothetical protein
MEHPAEKLFYRLNTRSKIQHSAGQILAQRVLYVYNAFKARLARQILMRLLEILLLVLYDDSSGPLDPQLHVALHVSVLEGSTIT